MKKLININCYLYENPSSKMSKINTETSFSLVDDLHSMQGAAFLIPSSKSLFSLAIAYFFRYYSSNLFFISTSLFGKEIKVFKCSFTFFNGIFVTSKALFSLFN